MTSVLNAIHTNYIKNFPNEVPTKAAQGFVVTAVIHLVIRSGSSVALLGGAIAATATMIEAATRPIIKAIFPENPYIAAFTQIVTTQIMAVGLATSIAPWLGVAFKLTPLVLHLILWPALNYECYKKNVGMVGIL